MNVLCKFTLHNFRTAPNGMLRLCSWCGRWEVNLNLSCDPIPNWKEIDEYGREKLIQDWKDAKKLL
jgi:hypothetical protein